MKRVLCGLKTDFPSVMWDDLSNLSQLPEIRHEATQAYPLSSLLSPHPLLHSSSHLLLPRQQQHSLIPMRASAALLSCSPTQRRIHLLFVWSTSTSSGRSQTCIRVGKLTTSTHTPGHNHTRCTASQFFFCRQYWHLAAEVEKVSFQAVCHVAKDQIQIIKIN